MLCCEPITIRFSDHYEAFARLWQPADARGAVLYLHGIQSHGLWFEASAERLAEAGFVVLLPDRRGSGRNSVERGHTPSARRLVQDAAECLDELHVRTGLDRFHVLGVSWGGKLALALYRHGPARVDSLTLVAPGLFPRVDLPLGQKIKVGLSAIASSHSRFGIPLQEPELFTANPQRQAFIRDDALALRQVTAGFLIASRRLDREAQAIAAEPSGPPLRLFVAGCDRIVDTARTKAFVRELAWPDRQIIEYPEAHHTLEFERDPEPYFRDLVASLSAGPAESCTVLPGAPT